MTHRFNPYHAPSGPGGGQFTSGSSGGSGGKGGAKTPAKKVTPTHHAPAHAGHAAAKPAGKLTTTLSYNPKRNVGAGYGRKGGDPHVHEAQRALNRLGLTDASGKQLVDDGKLGPHTTAAIKKAQKALGLKQDGLLTPTLYERLLSLKSLPAKAPVKHAGHRKPHRSSEGGPMEQRAATDIYAEARHNDHDVTFLHNIIGNLQAGVGHAKAVLTNGEHPDVAAAAGQLLADHAAALNTMRTLAAQASTTSTATSGSSLAGGHGGDSGGGAGHGRSAELRSAGVRAALTGAEINSLPDSQFAYIEPGGTKDAEGKTVPRSKRHFPIHDAAHVRAALARAPQSPFGKEAMPKIMQAAKKFGIAAGDMGDGGGMGRSLAGVYCVRAFDFRATDRGGDGRTLEGYAAVFNSPSRIAARDGDFDEIIRPGAFAKSLEKRTPVLQFEHGRDPRVGAVPIGSIEDIGEDSQGLRVRARLFDNPVVEPVRQAIAERAIRGMSFRFLVPDGGDKWSRRSGDVDLREVYDADTAECGPVVFPAYDATSVSVRSLLSTLDPDAYDSLIRELRAEVLRAAGLPDLATEAGARCAAGGGFGARPGNGAASLSPIHTRVDHDGDSLRLRGILT